MVLIPIYYSTPNTQDDYGHGTHVAGIAAAVTDNSEGVASIAFDTSIMPLKVLDSAGNGYYSSVASGVIWAADHGAKVINLSLGGTSYSKTLEDAVNYADAVGALVIASSGNSGDQTVYYPAAYENAMAIGATNESDQRASFSSYGAELSVSAPGTDIISTFWTPSIGSAYGWGSGTSQAAPLVSGLAALLFSQNSTRTNDIVRNVIERSADDIGLSDWDIETGHGRINAYSAFVGDLTGVISNSETSESIPNATINVYQNAALVASAETDLNGVYFVPELPSGQYDIVADAEGYESVSKTVYISPAEENALGFVLRISIGSVSGRVYARKRSIVGATVEAKQHDIVIGSTTSDSQGNYVLTDLQTGTYDLTASADGFQAKTVQDVMVYAGSDTSGINFNLSKESTDEDKPGKPDKPGKSPKK
jgi:hypothetical protein